MSTTKISSVRYVLFATCVTAIGGFLFGYDTAFVMWSSNYIVTQTFPMMNDNPAIGPANTFWIYAAVSLLSFVFVLGWIPETKGRTLEEIEKLWTRAKETTH